MDVFRFHNPSSSTKMEQGEIISGLKSKMWVERYVKEGEFRFVANAAGDIRDKLPIGAFVSHVNSEEIMIVENHEISDQQGNEPEIVITGRGFETEFENRIVGSNRVFPISETPADYSLFADNTWDQAVLLINNHILASALYNDDDALPYISVSSSVVGSGISVLRKFQRGSLYDRLIELLSIENLGIKVIRPGVWSPISPSPNVAIVIHVGNDRTTEVSFSYDTGEIVSADYLWSNKNLKNAALVTGKWVETVVEPAETGYERRMMYITASDIDDDFESAPTGGDLTTVVAAMQQRGAEILASQNNVALTKAEVSKETPRSLYRIDFEVGDIITVIGDYNEVSSMRISEYVEIEDETGESGYPTLSMD